ncbi:MAG: hypothetical protein M3387_13695 [Actinomycetota bacterium]|nr:hypothetical protein [Actinomycetota bacterium]
MDQWGLLARVAAGQHGLVAVWQVEDLGIARQLLVRRVAEQGWHRVVRGVYLLPGMALTPLARIKAADLALRGRGLASHRTAAFVWGLRNHLVRPLEFVVPPHCTLRVQGVHIRRLGGVLEGDGARHTGVALTAPARTICTLSGVSSVTELVDDLATAHRLRLATPVSVRRVAEASARFAGQSRLREALERAEGELNHSKLERLGRQLLAGITLLPHPQPFVVADEGGFVAELDIAFPDYRVGVPIDGPHHFEPDQKRADDDQRHRLHLLDWLLVPADQLRLEHQPRVFVRQVTQALRKKGWSS